MTEERLNDLADETFDKVAVHLFQSEEILDFIPEIELESLTPKERTKLLSKVFRLFN